MELALNPRYYAHVPAFLWPVLFMRLMYFAAWVRGSGRKVMFQISADAVISVSFVEDDPNSLNTWLNRQANRAQSHTLACQNAAGLMHFPLIAQMICLAASRFGCFLHYIWVRVVLRDAPPIIDTS